MRRTDRSCTIGDTSRDDVVTNDGINNNSALIWSVAEILRGDLKQSEYQRVVLPLTVLRRLDAVLTPKKADFLAAAEKVKGMEGAETALKSIARKIYGHTFYNASPLDFKRLLDDPDNVGKNLKMALSVIVKEMNERHGEDLTQEHMLTLDQYTGRFSAEPQVVEAAKANDDFEAFRKIAFSPVFLDTIISQMNTNEEVFKLILSDERMREAFERYVAQTVYDTARSG